MLCRGVVEGKQSIAVFGQAFDRLLVFDVVDLDDGVEHDESILLGLGHPDLEKVLDFRSRGQFTPDRRCATILSDCVKTRSCEAARYVAQFGGSGKASSASSSSTAVSISSSVNLLFGSNLETSRASIIASQAFS